MAGFPRHRTMVRRIEKILAKATPQQYKAGCAWYQAAHECARQLGLEFNISGRRAAAIIAVLSPGVSWERNCLDAHVLLQGGPAAVVCTYGKNKDKALAIAAGDDIDKHLGGLKVRAFWSNIFRPWASGNVCIDRWVKRIVGWSGKLTPSRYIAISNAFRHVAAEHNLFAHQVQAIAWLVAREA